MEQVKIFSEYFWTICVVLNEQVSFMSELDERDMIFCRVHRKVVLTMQMIIITTDTHGLEVWTLIPTVENKDFPLNLIIGIMD